MNAPAFSEMDFIALLFYLVGVIGLVLLLLVLSHYLGEKRTGRGRQQPFESGIFPVGFARMPVDARFYKVAMLFVIFDMEAAFIIVWAIAFRSVGWYGYGFAMDFLFVLTVGLAYAWRTGALDWGHTHRRPRFPLAENDS